MPRPSARGSKRKKPLEEIPSSQSLEFVSHIQRGDRVVKKRTIEKTNFDPPTSPITFPNDDVLPAPGLQVDPSKSASNAFEGPSSDAASRSVSVKSVFICHITSHSRSSQAKVQEWISHCPEFLYELLRLECLLPRDVSCSACKPPAKSPAEYRCLSCVSGGLVCKDCLLSRHSVAPLHSIQVCPL